MLCSVHSKPIKVHENTLINVYSLDNGEINKNQLEQNAQQK